MKHNDMETKNNRGGARPGAGRRALAPGERRVPVCFSVSAEAKRRLQELRRMGVAVNEMVDEYIKVLHFDNTHPFAD